MTDSGSLAPQVAQLQHELDAARAELQDLTYTVSHDLRAPLRHINAFAQILAEDWPDMPPEAAGHLGTIRQSAQLLTRQLDGLLMLSRLGQLPVHLQGVSPVPLLQSVWDELLLAQPQRQIQWHCAQDIPALWADPDLLRQVLSYVLDNAIKATAARDTAQVGVTWQWLEDDSAQPGQGVRRVQINIHDNGIGFAPQQAGALFKVFGKLHAARDFAGLGLGLVACRKLLARMDGSIALSAQVDAGCQVQISLPAATPHQTCCA